MNTAIVPATVPTSVTSVTEQVMRGVGYKDDAAHPLRRYLWLSDYVQVFPISLIVNDEVVEGEYDYSGNLQLEGLKSLDVQWLLARTLAQLIAQTVAKMSARKNLGYARFLDESGAVVGTLEMDILGARFGDKPEQGEPPFEKTKFVLLTLDHHRPQDLAIIYVVTQEEESKG